MTITLASGLSLKQRGCALYLKDEYHEDEHERHLDDHDGKLGDHVGQHHLQAGHTGYPGPVQQTLSSYQEPRCSVLVF